MGGGLISCLTGIGGTQTMISSPMHPRMSVGEVLEKKEEGQGH